MVLCLIPTLPPRRPVERFSVNNIGITVAALRRIGLRRFVIIDWVCEASRSSRASNVSVRRPVGAALKCRLTARLLSSTK
jgi:hypothetical protein